jgi:hypothetical protein
MSDIPDNLTDNFRDARLRLGGWVKQNMCVEGVELLAPI